MLDSEEFGRWRAEADRALQAARVQASAGLHNWSCFAAEQAAQLAVKATLHGLGRAPWGHDLVRLGASLREAVEQGWPESIDASLRKLSRHYIPARYPDAHPAGTPSVHYGPDDSTQAIKEAEGIIEAVDQLWVRLSDEETS